MTMLQIPHVILSNDVKMPIVGYGAYKVSKEVTEQCIQTAFNTGYRHIDTASFYDNEKEIGTAINHSSLKREEIFLTTKVWNDDHGYDKTLKAFSTSLEKLQTSYVDLYLVHWPIKDTFVETYKALERLYDEGVVRAIGVSNFHIHHLKKIEASCNIKPMVNQVECHPRLSQEELLTYCNNENIQMEAWSPLMRAGNIFEHPIIQNLSKKYEKSAAQIILKWNVQRGIVVIPKSITTSRIIENIQLFDFTLSQEDMTLLSSLNENKRIGKDPDTV